MFFFVRTITLLRSKLRGCRSRSHYHPGGTSNTSRRWASWASLPNKACRMAKLPEAGNRAFKKPSGHNRKISSRHKIPGKQISCGSRGPNSLPVQGYAGCCNALHVIFQLNCLQKGIATVLPHLLPMRSIEPHGVCGHLPVHHQCEVTGNSDNIRFKVSVSDRYPRFFLDCITSQSPGNVIYNSVMTLHTHVVCRWTLLYNVV